MPPETTQILCFGHDAILLKTRQWILERQFRIEVVSDLAAFTLLVGRHGFNLAIFCQTLSLSECQQAIDLLQAHSPRTKVLNLVTSTQDGERSMFGHPFNPSNGPKAFSDCVATMLEPTAVASGQLLAG